MSSRPLLSFLLLVALFAGLLVSAKAWAAPPQSHANPMHRHSLARLETHSDGLNWAHVERVLLLRDYNTRVVLLGTSLLGACAGVVGVFMLLRRRSLLGDVVSHASLPGIALAFLVLESVTPGSGKSLPGLLVGAMIAGLLGVGCTTAIRRYTRIKEDAALAIVLSIFFGVGIALFTVVQRIPSGNAAGLDHFIFGKAASLVASDVQLIAGASVVVLVVVGLLLKEFTLLAFDERYGATQGWPVFGLDLLLMLLVVGVTVIGLQCVGLLLVVALLIIPPAAARFWTEHLFWQNVGAAILGGLSASLGVLISALLPRIAAGPMIVLVGTGLFVLSMLVGTRRGALRRLWIHLALRERLGRQHLLRGFYELLEPSATGASEGLVTALTEREVSFDELLQVRSWSASRLGRLLRKAHRHGLVQVVGKRQYRLTNEGALAARRVARNHRLWELYLLQYADVAPVYVDRDAEQIEQVLDRKLLDELEGLLAREYPLMSVPPSPHELPRASRREASLVRKQAS